MIFQSARLKLTAWYVAIIMVVSLSFSAFVYQSVISEVSRGFRLHALRNSASINATPDWVVIRRDPEPSIMANQIISDDENLFEEIRLRIIIQLGIVNAVILIGSALAGYFLAGKTLRPIEEMVLDQRRFIGDASHELRTPLTAMKTEIEVAMRDKKMTLSEAKDLLTSNLEEVDKMQSLSNYLLALNRYESGEKELPMKSVALNKVIHQQVQKLKHLADSKKIILKEEVQELTIKANETSIEELVSILLDNAIKYSFAEGEVIVSLKQTKSYVVLRVKDSGIGIKASDIPYIFNRFYRADTSRAKEKIDGYGLGLSIAKSIVEMHGGKIDVDSVIGKGTTFTVTLHK
jgi:signal transduction histidine kinase